MSDEWQPGFDGQRATTVLVWIAGSVVFAYIALQALLWWIYRPSPTVEATKGVRTLYDGSVAYFDNHNRFPASTAIYPEVDCGRRITAWDGPTWRALEFTQVDRHRYSFQYDSSGSGASAQFTASAFGDLDCDGLTSTFVRFGSVREIQVDVGPPRLEVRGSPGLYIADELE